MSKEDFPEKVASYLTKRFSDDGYFEPYKVDRGELYHHSTMESKELKWVVGTGGLMSCCSLEEDVTGRIWFFSGPTEAPRDTLLEEYDVVDMETRRRIVDELATDRENWKKYLMKFKRFIAHLIWADEVAKLVSEETDIEIVHFIPNSKLLGYDDSFLYTSFDSSGMSDDEKMKEIERRVDAIDKAYKLQDDFKAEEEFRKQHFGEEFVKQVIAERRRLIRELRKIWKQRRNS